MPVRPLDPAPRSYAPSVVLLRRRATGAAAAPAAVTLDDVEDWLLADAVTIGDLLELIEALVWRLVAAGLPLDRFSVHIGTLHPQLIGFAWNWNRADGLVDEVQVAASTLDTPAYRDSPLAQVLEGGRPVRAMTSDPRAVARFPFLAELAHQGIVDYAVLPIGGGSGYHNAASVATMQAGGFTEVEYAALRRVLRLMALHVERQIVSRIARNVLDTYLGAAVGARVLDGAIRRGAGEAIPAVIWVSDLRGFTDQTDRLAGPEVIAVLNAYFEAVVGAVVGQGGEVLKFVGDGLLAAFPIAGDGKAAAAASLEAAERALAAVDELNVQPPAELAAIEGWLPLRSGIALHEGEVFFGNVGAPERLDFTVIGRAVNEASRVEALTKTLGRPILVTEPVARRLDRRLEDLGGHALRGLEKPLALFAPVAPQEPASGRSRNSISTKANS